MTFIFPSLVLWAVVSHVFNLFSFLIADSLRTYIDENYREIRKYHQLQFWQDVCRNSAVLELIYDEKNFYPKPAEDTENFFADRFVTEYTAEDSAGRLEQLRTRVEQEVTDSDTELFAVGRAEGTKEPNGQRVLQVSIVQNDCQRTLHETLFIKSSLSLSSRIFD